MKPLSQWTEADLKELLGSNEGQSAEFKRSDALDLSVNRDKRIPELVKDVSAMANAAGGRIYYGVEEEKGSGRADRLDDGLDTAAFNLDQIGNLLTSNIEPAIPGVTTHAIRLSNGRCAIVIDVPQSMSLAPHQSRFDRVYYRRHDRKNQPMYDHEIRDVMRRATVPEIEIELEYERISGGQHRIRVFAKNLSDEPALYYSVDVHTDKDMAASDVDTYSRSIARLQTPKGEVMVDTFSRGYVTPHTMPLFKPRRYELAEFFAELSEHTLYWMAVSFTAPGFHGHWMIQLIRMGGPLMANINRER